MSRKYQRSLLSQIYSMIGSITHWMFRGLISVICNKLGIEISISLERFIAYILTPVFLILIGVWHFIPWLPGIDFSFLNIKNLFNIIKYIFYTVFILLVVFFLYNKYLAWKKRKNTANKKEHLLSSLNKKFVSLYTKQDVIDLKKLEVTQRFNEAVTRLEIRYQELLNAEHVLCTSKEMDNKFQIQYLDKLEGFFQGLYASISIFAKYLSVVGTYEFKKGLPISSVKNFINFLRKFTDLSVDLDILEKARKFRSELVDHAQMNKLYDWMTFDHSGYQYGSIGIIYFVNESADGTSPSFEGKQFSDPHADNYRPPITAKDYSVSPNYRKSLNSFLHVVEYVVNSL